MAAAFDLLWSWNALEFGAPHSPVVFYAADTLSALDLVTVLVELLAAHEELWAGVL